MFSRFNGHVEPFASDATGTERTVFGDTVQSDDINDNLNADFLRGWGIVGVNDNPTKQDFNALAFTISNLVAYLYQQGVAEWNTTQKYLANSYVVGSDGKIYRAKTGTTGTPNEGNDPTTDSTNWELLAANRILYDNSISGLTSEEVQSAIDELKTLVESAGVVGSIIIQTVDVVPSGYLECNGAELSRTTYSELFSKIGTTYGVGNGTTSFNIPDLRGEFIRGFDNGRGVDNGRTIGSFQADELKSHTHNYAIIETNRGSASGNWYSSYPKSNESATTFTGGSETRPRNIAMMYCIKY